MPTIIWKGTSALFTAGVNTTLVEQPDSPEYTFGEKVSCVRKFRGLHSLALSSAPAHGALGSGTMAGFKVASSIVRRLPRQIGELTINYEANDSSSGASLPPDEYGLHPFEVNPKTEQHPLFLTLTEAEREAVRGWVDAPDPTTRAANKALVVGALAQQLGGKLLQGIETYYLAGWTYTWSLYSWSIPTVVDGGYVETPGGPLDGYLGTGVDWLRQADDLDFDGTKHKLTRTWLGGPTGHWDADLYA
jgi:hypothetical protein